MAAALKCVLLFAMLPFGKDVSTCIASIPQICVRVAVLEALV